MNPILILDYAGIAVFAATGALAASRKQVDIIGFLFFAAITGIGGGTVRDLILDVPVFWVVNPDYLLICVVTAVLVYFTAHLFESRYKLLLWLDAIGLAAYCVFGAWKAYTVTGSPVIAVVMGVITASFGGILRDQMAGEPSILLQREIYITAALVGAGAYTGLAAAGLPLMWAAVPAALLALAIRGGAMRFGWSFPPYKGKPGRKPEDIP
ncbi:MAG: trimeric intracellular cation channel family protein [Hyphomonas sp.]|uniref:trimeric intracellular cation channel family protein n=1 Tax=Hyphomonas sp. TaxID=87 RepID=UPI0037C18EEC|nr:trimeric intracellular cation channel family protein [Hyphomonas sp.]